ncbi:putative DUF4143 family protein [Corynebacterium uterequi]|uniref:Putative DUF4143 family protein n=1 Tax=Corynebacterium uterequi TaxID=1072256 RepID=A0A0G3HGU5_9CORY|nr:putative DUF4143 family protein [Corynebacterium uterequi]
MGALFESLTALTVRAAAEPLGAEVSHLRTQGDDHEVDLILEDLDGRLLAFEVTLAHTITDADVRHLTWFRDKFADDVADLVVVYSGPVAFRRADGVACVPLALLGA